MRVGSPPALLAADHRGRVREPSQGSHLDRPPTLGRMLALGAADIATLRGRLGQALTDARAGKLPDHNPPGADFLGAQMRLVIAFEEAAELAKKGEISLEALDKNDARKWRILQTKGILLRPRKSRQGRLPLSRPGLAIREHAG